MVGKVNIVGCLLKNDRYMFIYDELFMERRMSGYYKLTISIDRDDGRWDVIIML